MLHVFPTTPIMGKLVLWFTSLFVAPPLDISLQRQAWYSDDADPKLQAVLCALSLIEDLNPSLGIFINLNIRGTLIGNYLFCSGFFAMKHMELAFVTWCILPNAGIPAPKLGWNCTPLAVESYGNRGHQKSKIIVDIHGRPWAISLPPAKKDDTDIGAFPETLMFTAPLREAQIHADVAKCWAEIPEGPAVVDVPLRKDHRIGERVALDSLSHHAVSCRQIGDTVIRHNKLHDIADMCHTAHLSVRVEAGHGICRDNNHSCPVDVLVEGWERGQTAVLDITVTSPLTPVSLKESSRIAVETYGNWGKEAQHMFSRLATYLAIHLSCPKSRVLADIYGRLNICLSLEIFNSSVHQSDNIQIGSVLEKLPSQKTLSSILDDNLFRVLQGSLSIADRARLLSASSPHASSWLTVTPSEGQGLHLDPPVFQTALKWWLGLDTAEGSICALCPDKMLDPLGHHATTCKRGGDVVFRHNKLRDILAETCRRAHLSVQVEAGCNLTPDHSHSRPADVLISNWVLGKTAACDISVTSPLNSNIMSEAGVTAGAAAQATELRKHEANDVKCSELGWLCIPLVVESYGAWGKEAMESFSSLASRLAITSSRPKSAVLSELYGRLNLNLVRANGLGLHLDAPVHQVAIKWWLGMDTSQGSQCALCPDNALDPLGHHAIACMGVMLWHDTTLFGMFWLKHVTGPILASKWKLAMTSQSIIATPILLTFY
eukprot:Em0319g3a